MRATATTVTPDDLETLRDGAMTVRQAVEFSGLNRTDLFSLMKAGRLPWFAPNGRTRMIPRRPLVDLLAELYAQTKG